MELYEAYEKNMLPKDEGYVVSAFYLPDSPYSILEIISYSEVKNFFASTDSLTFQSNGKKIYILVEPSSYNHKSQEPYVRPSKYQIPLRFNDLNIYTCKNQYKVMYNKEPQMMMTSFTVLKPTGHNFSLIVFQQDDIQKTLAKLFQSALHNESNVPLNDSKVISEDLAEMIVTKLCWPNKKTAKKAKSKEKTEDTKAKKETSSKKKSTSKKEAATDKKASTKKTTSTKKADSSQKATTAKKASSVKTSTTKKAADTKATKTTAKKSTEKKASSTKSTTTKKTADKKTTTAKSTAKSTKSTSKSKKTTDDDKTVVATKKRTTKK